MLIRDPVSVATNSTHSLSSNIITSTSSVVNSPTTENVFIQCKSNINANLLK